MDPTQGSNRSSHGSHKSIHSHKSCGSPANSERKPRRTEGPPDDLPFNSRHSSSVAPCSRQVAKVRNALSKTVQ